MQPVHGKQYLTALFKPRRVDGKRPPIIFGFPLWKALTLIFYNGPQKLEDVRTNRWAPHRR